MSQTLRQLNPKSVPDYPMTDTPASMHSYRFLIVGSALAILGVASMEPILGKYIAADRQLDFPANLIASLGSLFLVLSGMLVICWKKTIVGLGITGKECLIRLCLISLPFVVLAIVELVFILSEKFNPHQDADDILATQLISKLEGSLHYKNFNLFQPSKNPVFTTNKYGFRGREFDSPRGDEFRILLLGGSTAFGWQVADHHTIGWYLEQVLSSKARQPVHVYNLGVPAARFDHENMLLKDFIGIISPDLVLFYHGANDGLSWYQQSLGRARTKLTLKPAFFSTATLLHYAFELHIFRYAANFAESLTTERGQNHIDVSAAIADYKKLFAAASDICMSTRCLFVLQPILFDKNRLTNNEIGIWRESILIRPKSDQMYRTYIDRILELKLDNHVDARPAISESDEDAFHDVVHLTAAGNRLMAKYIVNAICAARTLHCE